MYSLVAAWCGLSKSGKPPATRCRHNLSCRQIPTSLIDLDPTLNECNRLFSSFDRAVIVCQTRSRKVSQVRRTPSPNEYRSYFTLRHRAASLVGVPPLDRRRDFNLCRENSYTRSRFGQPRQRADDVLVHSGNIVLSWHSFSVSKIN
jgi:hypothetical protein